MKKQDLFSWISLLATPVVLVALGLLLLLRPDSVSALLATVLGWAIVLAGAGFVAAALLIREGTAGKVIGALVCFALGGWLLNNPLALASGIGRLVGIVLLIRGGQDLLASHYGQSKLLSLITAVVGLILIVLPLTTSRLVFALCGALVLAVGIGMLLERLRWRRLNGGEDDPNIIDAL